MAATKNTFLRMVCSFVYNPPPLPSVCTRCMDHQTKIYFKGLPLLSSSLFKIGAIENKSPAPNGNHHDFENDDEN